MTLLLTTTSVKRCLKTLSSGDTMARITTEHGKGREFVFEGPARNISVIFDLFTFFIFSARDRYSRSSRCSAEHTVRLYKDKMEICKFSEYRDKFELFSFEEIKSVKKGVKIFKIPLLIAIAITVFSFAVEFPWFLFGALPFVLTCFSRCITITLKNHRVIKIPYYALRYSEMIDMIVGNFL